MAAPSRSSPPRVRRALRGAGALVGYVTLGGLCLGGGIALQGVVDAGADQPRPPAAAAAVTTTTETTIPMPTIVTTTTSVPPPPPAAPTTVPAPAPVAPPAAAALPATGPTPTPSVPADRRAVWFELADCESGRWGAGKVPIPGTATWDVVDPIHQGGLQIRAGQWDQHRPPGFPDDAHVATPDQQIAVAEIILAGQGVRAWPTCGPRIGLDRLTGPPASGAA